jgi:hypothetical protein
MKTERKATDYNVREVEPKLVAALRRRREATIADLVTDTALPRIQVEEGMRLVLHEYVGHLKATESGELLYSFPSGMRNQLRGFWPTFRRGLRAFGRGASKVLVLLFKVWIAAMLVGYFALFVALFVLAIVASIAASMSGRQGERDSRSRSSGGGFLGFAMVSRVIDLLFIRIILNSGTKRDKGQKGRPLHKSVFGYVFGEGDADKEWTEHERKAILRYLRTQKGLISLEEIIRITGRDRAEAEKLATALMVEYEGEPIVTERGTILYSFQELLRTRTEALAAERGGGTLRSRPLVPFSGNKPKTNRWITFFNAFNLVFGGYFLSYSVMAAAGAFNGQGAAGFFIFVARLAQQFLHVDPLPLLGIGLGAVPVAFALVFFAVPLLRKLGLEKRNEEIRQENMRRDLYGAVMARPQSVSPEEIAKEALERDRAESGRLSRTIPRKAHEFVRKEVEELAGAKNGTVEEAGGAYRYGFPELLAEIEDIKKYRSGVDTSKLDVGDTVFDSAE